MDIKAKYTELFYKTCVLIEALDDFENFLRNNIVSSTDILYDAHFRNVMHLRELFVKLVKE